MNSRLDRLITLALEEDIGQGDVTTEATIHEAATGKALVFARESFVLSGSQPFCRVFELLDPRIRIKKTHRDGDKINAEDPFFFLEGSMCALLSGERTALNLLQRLSGIATLTRRMVDAMEGSACRLLDTRKTTPLWRELEKAAVRHGGGTNHRFGLFDGILIKDNHIAAAGGVRQAVERGRRHAGHLMKIEVEVETFEQLEEALDAGADVILLDNFSIEMLREAVDRNRGRAILEASGGVSLERVARIARTGVHFVSCGALTHSARAIDITMEVDLPAGWMEV
ncbi:MAG: carboxylating nicotinate-nucleotide diphosphorylase [Deltaproteobacteria bacterium]|nr:carboxylating nicotinate-nucleotide diphosphorylase [Deltaproteobacteria bacterium]